VECFLCRLILTFPFCIEDWKVIQEYFKDVNLFSLNLGITKGLNDFLKAKIMASYQETYGNSGDKKSMIL
jgi:Na+-transporting NADH:ubiquinone oxidoreductase subunit NqrF